MSSKDEILQAIRTQLPQAVELPTLDEDWITYNDPVAQFTKSVATVGGQAVVVEDLAEANKLLDEIGSYSAARKRCSLVSGVGESNVDLDSIDDPHELEDVDFAVLPGHFGVAENGAIWITDDKIEHRVIYFLTQHLAIVIPAEAVVSNMHEAYKRIGADAQFSFKEPGFSAFVSGPSKTADIEQSLVIGAHGARSLTVLLLKDNRQSTE